MWVQSLGWEDSLGDSMATHSSVPAWRISRTEEPGSYSPWGHRELDVTEATWQAQTQKLRILFYVGDFLRTSAQDAASQTALRDPSEQGREGSGRAGVPETETSGQSSRRLLLTKETQAPQVKEFITFLSTGRPPWAWQCAPGAPSGSCDPEGCRVICLLKR